MDLVVFVSRLRDPFETDYFSSYIDQTAFGCCSLYWPYFESDIHLDMKIDFKYVE